MGKYAKIYDLRFNLQLREDPVDVVSVLPAVLYLQNTCEEMLCSCNHC